MTGEKVLTILLVLFKNGFGIIVKKGGCVKIVYYSLSMLLTFIKLNKQQYCTLGFIS